MGGERRRVLWTTTLPPTTFESRVKYPLLGDKITGTETGIEVPPRKSSRPVAVTISPPSTIDRRAKYPLPHDSIKAEK